VQESRCRIAGSFEKGMPLDAAELKCHGSLCLGTLFDEEFPWEQGLVWKYRENGEAFDLA
jgi:hypothetical protein